MRMLIVLLTLLAIAPLTDAQELTLTRIVRLKIAAGDLATGAHAAEDYRLTKGADKEYWDAIGWLARGAEMLGKPHLAAAYVAELQRAIPNETEELLVPYGAAMEVQGRLIAARDGRGSAIRYFDEQLRRAKATSLRSRISKNINLLSIEGSAAPEIAGRLAALRGKTVLVYLFAEWCGDCKSQAAALGRIWQKYEKQGLAMLAVTRLYDDERPEEEEAKVAKVWSEVYAPLANVPVVIDTDAMVRYGASATPTFALIDREGVVRFYAPTRLSEAELSRRIDELLTSGSARAASLPDRSAAAAP